MKIQILQYFQVSRKKCILPDILPARPFKIFAIKRSRVSILPLAKVEKQGKFFVGMFDVLAT
jgi:hypothetical protein